MRYAGMRAIGLDAVVLLCIFVRMQKAEGYVHTYIQLPARAIPRDGDHDDPTGCVDVNAVYLVKMNLNTSGPWYEIEIK